MGILSFFYPLIGFTLWAIKKDTNPDDARKCLKFAWWGFGISIALSLIVAFIMLKLGSLPFIGSFFN